MNSSVGHRSISFHARWVVAALAVTMIASSCKANNSETAASTTTAADGSAGSTTPDDAGTDGMMFGTLPSPCGPGEATVKADQAGRGTDKLYIGVGNDRDSIRPGLLKELWDASLGFAAWCNEQGGIAGLEVEAVDLDGKILEVEAAMATACTDVFAIVGGGWAQDNFLFSGKDGADFHKCDMIAIPGFAVSPDFTESTDQVQSIPNALYNKPTSAMVGLAKLHPEEVKKFGIAYGNLPSIVQNKDQNIAVAKTLDGYDTFAELIYDPFNQDWAVIAQQIINQDLKAIMFIGEPSGLSKFYQALKDQNFDGVVFAEGNHYDQRLIEVSGPDAVEGAIIRTVIHPFEESADSPVTKQLVDILDKHVPDWVHAGLAAQSFSANLLFATAARACADSEGEITRECVLQQALDTHEWDAGGLIAATDPGNNRSSECAMLVVVKDGGFERLFPEIGSSDDDGDGYHCTPNADIKGDFGAGNRESSILDG